jgi:hypothetical protein
MKKSFICPICESPFTDPNYRIDRKYCSRKCCSKGLTVPVKERFEKYIIPEPNSGCWLWGRSWNVDGYGIINIRRKLIRAHRVSWELYVGPIPDGLHVLHKCDTPPCVNPAHLFLGNQIENIFDRDRKGRNKGIFTEEQIRAIRRDNRSQSTIGKKYGVSRSAIGLIRAKKTYCRIN